MAIHMFFVRFKAKSSLDHDRMSENGHGYMYGHSYDLTARFQAISPPSYLSSPTAFSQSNSPFELNNRSVITRS